ncbi:Nicastrin-domain-containing protein [Basidiobolus meristosporus CBS 931.73]|uniref:Nicastrin-domain-containing protein n=1 Tax=Basidiobolus meristosporus CBS 931.73 TaxID=1314790 RepID=A0A1Y1XVR2_9FUNG|nr:Nicastrin-domain-containing protein [Basidiobolus meristosporus CBS 931.73]|eukprot:ORX89851.1 Nicastrin-domain-containing protein [Basidiobolus meristosporus CBS 931.73]
MYATRDSETCLRRGIQRNDGKPVIVLSTAIDSNSFFHDLASGFDNNLSGMIGLMAVAEALSKSPVTMSSLPKHVVYTFFNTESWGYSGSSRFVQDISTPFTCQKTFTKSTSSCPYIKATCEYPCTRDNDFGRINFDSIESIIELNQIGKVGSFSGEPGFFLHQHDNSTSSLSLANSITKQSGGSVTRADSDNIYRGLPPSSTMSFLKKKAIPAAVITDFRSEVNRSGYPGNTFYNSMLDAPQGMELAKSSICSVATVVAKATLAQASGNENLDTSAVQANCTLVLNHAYFNPSQTLTMHPLFHDAYGTGLALTEEGQFIVKDQRQPVWTESTWDPIGFQLFQVPSYGSQVMELIIGISMCALSVVCVILVRRYLSKHFKVD